MKWPGTLVCIIEDDEVVIRYEFKRETVEFAIGIHVVPEDCRVIGTMCRITKDGEFEWCRDVYSQEEIDQAKAKALELSNILDWGNNE